MKIEKLAKFSHLICWYFVSYFIMGDLGLAFCYSAGIKLVYEAIEIFVDLKISEWLLHSWTLLPKVIHMVISSLGIILLLISMNVFSVKSVAYQEFK